MEVLRSPKAVGLQVAEGCRSPGRRRLSVSRSPRRIGLQVAAERMYSDHRIIGLQVTTGGHRMRAYMSPQGDLRYVSSNPKPRLGTRCSAHTPSLGLQAGRRKSGIETWPVREIQQSVKPPPQQQKQEFYSIYRSSRNIVFSKTVQLIC